jgi:formylmethanofuran dehydrogenase subunit E
MKAALWFSCTVPEKMLDEAVRFHGHLGAFLVLGLKAGLLANELLGKDVFETRVVVETDPVPPYSCIVDGIQIATGCTIGKGNIALRNGPLLSVTFMKGDRRLKIYLKDKILERLKIITSKDESRKMALTLIDKHIQEFFDIEE